MIVQKDLQNCVQDYQKVKNLYQEEVGLVNAEDLITGSNSSTAAKQSNGKRYKRVKPRASTTNAYVLSMLTANTHQERYFNIDLQQAVKSLELGTYQKGTISKSAVCVNIKGSTCTPPLLHITSKNNNITFLHCFAYPLKSVGKSVRKYFSLVSRTELLTSLATRSSYSKIKGI